MNHIRNFEVILDVDDVLLDCNRYALTLLSQQDGVPYSIDRITDWGLLGIPEDRRLDFLKSKEFYEQQPALPGAAGFLKDLCEIANVTIMTAVYPQFMGERIRRLGELFPFFPQENIIMGRRKEMLQADVILDDGVHNLYGTGLTLPVLFRQPWNRHVSGICSINYYNEFLSLVQIMQGKKKDGSRLPKVFCIVGPSGSGKHEFARALCEDPDYAQIRTCTTSSGGTNHTVSPEEFQRMAQTGCFLETTYYGCHRYGLPKEEIDRTLASGRHAAAVMDISGCMAVHNHYPGQSIILYVERDKRACIEAILLKKGLERRETVDRIISYDFEEKNKILADRIITADPDGSYSSAIRTVHGMV